MIQTTHCEIMTGFPPVEYDFLATITTADHTDAIEFFISEDCEVDWGDGIWVEYDAGVVHGFGLAGREIINIRSSHEVKKVYFGNGTDYNNTYLKIDIKNGTYLEDATRLCYRLESLEEFVFRGANHVKTWDEAWDSCTELIAFNGLDTTQSESFYRSWRNCNKLQSFPPIYARNCKTVEGAWEGCTSMQIFPAITVSQCENFNEAWKGNVKLDDFPIIDTSSGLSFFKTWMYNANMTSFPTLDFSNAETMEKAFAYNYRAKRMPAINSGKNKNFEGMFEKNIELRCITAIDSRAQSNTIDMFKATPQLLYPTIAEQTKIKQGFDYKNANPCISDVGRSDFYIVIKTDGNPTTIQVDGNDCEIDWGEGTFMHYGSGIHDGVPVDSDSIRVRSEEKITGFKILSDTAIDIAFLKGKHILSMEDSFRGLTKLKSFHIEQQLPLVTNYDRMLMGCINLETMPGPTEFSLMKTGRQMLKGCRKFQGFDNTYGHIDMLACEDFTEMFSDNTSLEMMNVILSDNGKRFDGMFHNCIGLKCIFGMNTNSIVLGNSSIFNNTPLLARPNRNERKRIEAGTLYNNGGNCGSAFTIEFTEASKGNTHMFTTDDACQVDWGDGIFKSYQAGTISGSIINGETHAYIIGDCTAFSFDTDTFKEVSFYSVDHIKTFKNMFKDKSKIQRVVVVGAQELEDTSYMFENSSIEEFHADSTTLENVITAEGMFENTQMLKKTGRLNLANCKNVEKMFKNASSITCIGGINTMSANFPEKVYRCTTKVSCRDYIKCWGGSSMFDGANALISPNKAEQEDIMTRDDFFSTVCGGK